MELATTSLVAILMLIGWQWHPAAVGAFWLVFTFIEASFLSSNMSKVSWVLGGYRELGGWRWHPAVVGAFWLVFTFIEASFLSSNMSKVIWFITGGKGGGGGGGITENLGFYRE